MDFNKPGRTVFVTADTHFADDLALGKFSRPFSDTQTMDTALVDAINARVGKGDVLLHVGDFVGEVEWSKRMRARLVAVRDAIVCKRIVLIRGNLDPEGERWYDAMFEEVHDILTWKGWTGADGPRELRVVACHYPMRQWQGWPNGAVHLYGHTHATLPELGRSTDVGVDCWSYQPVELTKILDMLAARPFGLPSEWPRVQAMRSEA